MIIEILATLCVLLGVFFISIPRIEGQYIMCPAQIFWTIFAVYNAHWVFALQSVTLLVINIFAIRNWRKKNVGREGSLLGELRGMLRGMLTKITGGL